MADVAGIGIACGNCLLGVFYQWWYTKSYGAHGLPGASERPSRWLAIDCGFQDEGEADSIFAHYAAASEREWEAYLRGTPLPRRASVVRQPEAEVGMGMGRERPGLGAWPSEMRPALKLFGKFQEEVGGRVRKGGEIMLREMDVARKMRGERGEGEGSPREESLSPVQSASPRSPRSPEAHVSPLPPALHISPSSSSVPRPSNETVPSDSGPSATGWATATEGDEPEEGEESRPLTPTPTSPPGQGWRLPALPLPSFLQSTAQSTGTFLQSTAQSTGTRILPMLNQARIGGGAGGLEEETDVGVYRRLGEQERR